MNKREVFDKVAKHLLDQGKQAISSIGCAYRGRQGLACAVGCLIPDDVYDPAMEGNTVYQLIERYPKIKELFGEHLTLLQGLQYLHDKGQVSEWECRLQGILKDSVLA